MTALELKEVRHDGEHGGKAAQLGAALRAGLPVPPGFAIAHEHRANGDAALRAAQAGFVDGSLHEFVFDVLSCH